MSKGLILGGGVMGLGLMWLLASSKPGPNRERMEAILTARFGQLGAGLRWSDVCYLEVAERLGLENIPTAADARALIGLTQLTLAPVTNLHGGRWDVVGGFRTPAVDRQVPGACRLRGHTDGSALDVKLAGLSETETLRAVQAHAGPYRRVVVADGFLHVEYDPLNIARRTLVQLPSGVLVPAEIA